jgi:hypothetical protein
MGFTCGVTMPEHTEWSNCTPVVVKPWEDVGNIISWPLAITS